MHDDLDDKTQIAFLLSAGQQCPACHEYELEDDEKMEYDGLTATQRRLYPCGFAFVAVFELKYFSKV